MMKMLALNTTNIMCEKQTFTSLSTICLPQKTVTKEINLTVDSGYRLLSSGSSNLKVHLGGCLPKR